MTVVTSIAAWLLKTLGIAGCALAIVLLYYNGLPFLNRYPWLADVPIVGQIGVGRVQTYAADQVKTATAQQTAIFNAKIEKLVSASELTAANAQLAETQRQRDAANKAVIALNMRQADDDAFDDQLNAQNDQEIAEYEAKLKAAGRACTVDAPGAVWLRNH